MFSILMVLTFLFLHYHFLEIPYPIPVEQILVGGKGRGKTAAITVGFHSCLVAPEQLAGFTIPVEQPFGVASVEQVVGYIRAVSHKSIVDA